MKKKIINSLEDIPERYINDWVYISNSLFLSESFIEEYQDKVDWRYISTHQNLSESFIEKYQDKVIWYYISFFQHLSESFIEKYHDKVEWDHIFINQILSEEFIEKHINDDYHLWDIISSYHNLSEEFIDKHVDKVNWLNISQYQNLSDEFLNKHLNKIDIELYNKSHRVMTYEERLGEMSNYAKEYSLEFDGKYLYAYRNHDNFGRGFWNKTIRYEVGKYYRDWHCDMDVDNPNSFGLGIFPNGNVKVKVSIDDWGLWLKDSIKCRVWGFTVLEQN